jgi:DNA polymerase/3'-5' exonuclease PolX
MREGVLHDKASDPKGFKARAYSKAMASIAALEAVTSIADVKDLEGVGGKTLKKVEEILATGSLKAAARVEAAIDLTALRFLEGIHGIGPVRAKSLVEAGLTTLATLRAAVASNPKLLTKAQQLGLRHYEAGLQRIPRAEMREHEVRLQSLWEDHGLVGVLVGSYRRGAADSGDIDVLLRGGFDAEVRFAALVASLGGYIVGSLTSGKTKWMGYVQLPGGIVRRLDLMLTPPAEYACAILYFTGSDKFNIAFRSHCLSIGYTLNEHALTPKGATKAIPLFEKEEDIFAFVGLRYVPPTERVDGKQIVPL